MQVNKEFRYAVGGIKSTTFAKGTSADALPADARAYAQRKGLLSGGGGSTKAIDPAPENKAIEPDEDKSERGRGRVK